MGEPPGLVDVQVIVRFYHVGIFVGYQWGLIAQPGIPDFHNAVSGLLVPVVRHEGKRKGSSLSGQLPHLVDRFKYSQLAHGTKIEWYLEGRKDRIFLEARD